MKTVPLHDYKHKKLIADNLSDMINDRYIEITDEEFDRINTAITQYNEAIDEMYDRLVEVSLSEEQKSYLALRLEQLAADIRALKTDTFFVTEEGLHFTDDQGNIAATIDENGMHTIGEARDLSITDY